MTDLTPEQYRALAERADDAGGYELNETTLVDEMAVALRAAADQLEAVRCICGPQSVISDGPNTGCPVHGEQSYPCKAKTPSWEHFRPEQVDSYWITCDVLGPHDEHEDRGSGLRWSDKVGHDD